MYMYKCMLVLYEYIYVHVCTYICIGVVFQLAAEFILIERRILYAFCVPDRK